MKTLIDKIRKFNEERDWEQYHTPKNLVMALSVEVAEIMEIFQWKTAEEGTALSEKEFEQLKQEIGDVFIYILNLADKFNIDPIQAALEKIEINRKKYPVQLAKGNAKKYTEYQ